MINKAILVVAMLLFPWAHVSCLGASGPDPVFESLWHGERMWVGPSYWGNRLHDWEVSGGRLECVGDARRLRMRTLHLLTHRIKEDSGTFEMEVFVTGIAPESGMPADAATGFLIGVGGSTMDYRAAAIIHGAPGPGGGYFAGINGRGEPFIIDNEQFWYHLPVSEKADKASTFPEGKVRLRFSVEPGNDGTCTLHLNAGDKEATLVVPAERLAGGVALVSHPGECWDETEPKPEPIPGLGGRFAFEDWKLYGTRVVADQSRTLGPILSTQYTLSEGVLKMTAQMMPIGERDNKEVLLQTRSDAGWETIARATIIVPGYTAPFRVADWDASKDTPFRVSYTMQLDGSKETFTWPGTIRRDPVDKETIVVAGFTGNHNNSHRIGAAESRYTDKRTAFDWTTGMWFPHAQVTGHVAKQAPDVLFFSGDQVYENSSPSYPDCEQAKLDYLYKWYLWCWAYRDLTRDIPSVTIPDDHDVYQANLWGESGRPCKLDDEGGYQQPPDFVNMVERTQTSHLPDPVDPKPVEQGIGVYFTDMTYGRIGFAILEDRKFKTGCRDRVPGITAWRKDLIRDPDYDMKQADQPGLVLLGKRQLAFLDEFVTDWAGQDMKMALSQTIFANMATHLGSTHHRIYGDLDSNGWPQSGRNRALRVLRKGFIFHMAGDQHLASMVHHGVDEHNDAIWSFCVPSVANFFPRSWMPESEGKNRPAGAPANMGEHLDGFGNHVTVFAVANPTTMTKKSTGVEPLELHDSMAGYGIVKLNKRTREITMECWPRYADPEDPNTGTQYEGWPKTVSQLSNYDRKAVAYLPTLVFADMKNPVVIVSDEDSGETVYALRISGTSFRPKVFKPGTYALSVGEPNTDRYKVLHGIKSLDADKTETINIEF